MKRKARERIFSVLLIVALLLTQMCIVAVAADNTFAAVFTQDFAELDKPLTVEVSNPPQGEENLKYAWTVDGKSVGTNSNSYTPKEADLEKTIAVTVTCTKTNQKVTVSTYFSRLPVVYIETEGNKPVVSKDYYLKGTMKLQGNSAFSDQKQLYDGEIEIKGRGNSTWGQPKKPYRLKLASKANIFGMGKNKHWVLLANYIDRSLLRNTLSYKLAGDIGVDFTDTEYVVVLLNGEYLGNYQLCEQIRVGEFRTEIHNWEDDVADETNLSSITKANGYDTTGGYLLEINSQFDEVSKFRTNNNVPITFKHPEFANTNSEMMSYVQGYIQDYENACLSTDFYNNKGQHYSDLFDFDDLIDYWLANEFMNNVDTGRWSSTYMYKDIGGDKFHMGPVWDYDYSSGNYLHTEFYGYSCPPDHWQYGQEGLWYSKLVGDPYFVSRLVERYWELHDLFAKQQSVLDKYVLQITESANKNHQRWGMPYTFQYEYGLLRTWLGDRLNWIDTQFASLDNAVKSLNMYKPNTSFAISLSTPDGKPLPADTVVSSGVPADAMIEDNRNVIVTVTTNDSNTKKVSFYLNSIRVGEDVNVVNGKAVFELDNDLLVGSGSKNVIQVRGKNSSGSFTTSNFISLAKEKYAADVSFVWPSVDNTAGYIIGTKLSDVPWAVQGTARYTVDGMAVEIPGVFSWANGDATVTDGRNNYEVIFTPDEAYRESYATLTGSIMVLGVEAPIPEVSVTLPETIIRNEEFNAVIRTRSNISRIVLKNENDRAIAIRVVSRKIVEPGFADWTVSLSIGTAGTDRTLTVYNASGNAMTALGTFSFDVQNIPTPTGILKLEAPENAVAGEQFQVIATTTTDLIKGVFYNEYGRSIGRVCVSKNIVKGNLVSTYELMIATPGENRDFVFKADYNGANDFPFEESFVMSILPKA